jgi:preprotein translocase subunit SecF
MAKSDLNIDFMGKRKIATVVSLVLVCLSIASLAVKQLEWGLDFTGGTLVEVYYETPVNPEDIRRALEQAGLEGFVVQYFGSEHDVLVRIAPQKTLSEIENARLGDKVIAVLEAAEEDGSSVSLRRAEYVGPAVGDELRDQGGLGILLALVVVMVYVAFRFQFKFAIGAVVALFHDVVITLGLFSLFDWEFDLTVLAALLAVIGYSLNDTIVVADRIRENFRRVRRSTPIDIINLSLNQTLARTLITSGTTLLVLLALFFLGGALIHGFAKGLLIGILVGTYSSIYIAASILLLMNISKEDLAIPVKEGADDPGIGLP